MDPLFKKVKHLKESALKGKKDIEIREWVKSGIENQFILYLNKFYPGIGFGHERTEDYKKVLYKKYEAELVKLEKLETLKKFVVRVKKEAENKVKIIEKISKRHSKNYLQKKMRI